MSYFVLNVVKDFEIEIEMSCLLWCVMEFSCEKEFKNRDGEKNGLNKCICKYVNKYSWQMYMSS